MEASPQLRKLAAGPVAEAEAAASRSAQVQAQARAPSSRGWLDLFTFDSGPGASGGAASPADAAAPRGTANDPSSLLKVVVGNKKLMSQEDVVVPPHIDDYMREMEVGARCNAPQGPP